MNKKPKTQTTRELHAWCGDGQEKVLQMVDVALDKLNVDKPETKDILKQATDILKEIEELEAELEELLNK
jgi:hypothetical protein